MVSTGSTIRAWGLVMMVPATRSHTTQRREHGLRLMMASVLSALLDVAIADDDTPVPILERPWVQQLREQVDPQHRLRLLAHNGRLILERTAPIYEVLRGAARPPPTRRSPRSGNRPRPSAWRASVPCWGRAPLRHDLPATTAADIFFAIGSPETYRLLVVDRGWPVHQFEHWYADTLARLLLEEQA